MGRGDKKTKRGKIFKGSFGVVRPKKAISNIIEVKEPKKANSKAKKKTKK
ncbi:MAG: 30S ribosomal protein THX [Flavobacteriales bacterium]|nr:30S ribosomal protein THX [Flavobacteriales bacterium]|tara:strand:- start:10349 stop:10498 length:150 start_codon:yes stop_codon:yes gene_type:complete